MRIISLGAAHVSDAIETRTKCRSADVQRYAAYTAILQGDIAYADSLLEKAEKRAVKAVFDIEGIGAFAGAEYLLRRGNAQAADSLLRSLRKRLVDAKSSDQLARCDAILSRAALQQGKLPLSLQHLENAKKTFASAHMIYDLASLLVTEARYRMAGKNWSEASACLERALQLSAPRKYRLIQVDALNARSRLICESSKNMNSARDDAEAALILAEFCDYAWGQWEACTQLAVTLRELGDPEAGSYQGRASIWDHRLRSGEFQYW
jgi:tetratricopeptide (TPR) repeat protein